jgi:hypothetical protein
MPELDWTGMEIHLAIKRDVKMPERLIEGSLGCAKTTLGLDCEIDALIKHPGIPVLLFRWTEDAVTTKLRVAFEELCHIRGIEHSWDSKEKRYTLPNGSTAYAFGLKANSLVEEFNKIRGIGVSRIFGDQVEEVRPSVAAELRGRLRPNLAATLRNERYPMQLTFVANPSDYEFWLSKEFPESNSIKGRKMYSISIFDNKHLPQESIDSMLRQYAPDHPKYLTLVMGRRGPNVTGVPVYEGLYDKSLHWRPMAYDPRTPILESFEFGKHTPTWVCAQALRSGGLAIIGGMIGEGLVLEDFLPLVRHYRQAWFPTEAIYKTCTGPMGEQQQSLRGRYTPLDILRRHGFSARWRDNGNSPDVRLAMIENIASYLRRRNGGGEECIGVNNAADRFIIDSRDEHRDSPFVHHAFAGGYTWDPHFTSVANKELRQPYEDDKFANVMHAIENIELNFCAGQQTQAEQDTRRSAAGHQILTDEFTSPHAWMWQ